MASLHPRQLQNKQIVETLRYFDKFDYPLTWDEIKYWVARRGFNPLRLRRIGLNPMCQENYYFLPGRSHLVWLRQQREIFSRQKWQIANRVGEKLSRFPTIAAVFVTGALAMNNSPADDDIDLMIVTYPNTLWITRFFLNLYLDLNSLRRYPGQTQAPDKICPNLWLDMNHLVIVDHDLPTAHEILQAKVLWNRSGVYYQFLKQNSWVKEYLPVAYSTQKSKVKSQNHNSKVKSNYVFAFCNLVFYLAQYLYMLPKKTTERVGLGYAFFHPRG